MSVPASIIVAALIMSMTAMFLFRWHIVVPEPASAFAVIRLDRWTGEMSNCGEKGYSYPQGVPLWCKPK